MCLPLSKSGFCRGMPNRVIWSRRRLGFFLVILFLLLKLIVWYVFLHHAKRFFEICSIYRDTAILVDICIPNVIRRNAIWHEIRWYNSREHYICWKNVKLREIMQHYVNWRKKGTDFSWIDRIRLRRPNSVKTTEFG